ncbi:bromodomain-containing protein 7-like isoform X1 [Choristoneura fumiferana]|uniref:bromodomain-containing protein 7-like isoform X1 n=1 Tax=Choristoneura fumiferana TaxID=7141 RepID=UPI003D15D2A8
MDDMDKLSCKEVLDMSDVENSATDDHREMDDKPKKKKRRRREIDMIKLSDDDDTDDEGLTKKLHRRLSPGPSSREPRTCVLKASQKRRPLSRLLEQLLRNLEKRDPHQFFAWPVNDNFAPGYSNIIRRPMDFSTIKQKIDDNEYKSLNCFISDFKLMCNNAMKYNKAGTVYHKAARRLLHAGLKQLTPQKLRPLGDMLTYMYEIPIRELGFDIGKMDVPLRTYGRKKVLKRSSPIKSGGSEAETVSDGQERQDSGDSVKIQMEAAREQHRRRLAKKAFPNMDAEGKTTLNIVTNPVDATAPADERPMTLGQYVGKLTQGTGTLYAPREDRRNLVKGVKPLNYGPFSSFAPSYDGTFAKLTKEESHLLYHTLPSETGNGNEEMLRFAPDSPWALFYDMEAMFPDRKKEPEAPPAEDNDISKVRVDIEQLRSLSSLGIDVDFLNDIEDEVAASQRDYGIAAALTHTAQLLQKLEKEQGDRLSGPLPWHLSLAARLGGAERELARQTTGWLRGMCARVPPAALAPLSRLRRAMGVTLDHLDTPMAVDDFELEMHEHTISDPDSRSSHDK